MLQAAPIFTRKDYRDVLRREMDAGKIPLSLGRDCPVKCEFCYEQEVARHGELAARRASAIDRRHLLGVVGAAPRREGSVPGQQQPGQAPAPAELLRPLAEYEAAMGGAW